MEPNDENNQKIHFKLLDNIKEKRFQKQITVFNYLESEKNQCTFVNEARKKTNRNKQFTELTR